MLWRRSSNVVATRRRIDRLHRVGQCTPLQQLERTDIGDVDRISRQHQHSVLAGMQAVAPGIVAVFATGTTCRAVAIEVKPAGDTGVDRRQVAIGIVQRGATTGLRRLEVIVLEKESRTLRRVVIERRLELRERLGDEARGPRGRPSRAAR